jgi:hypothetical protein
MNPDNITLDNINKLFEYEKISRDIDSINDVNILQNMSKSYVKLYLKQQEILSSLKWQNQQIDSN